MKLLSKYQNGNTITELYSDGTRIRTTEDDEFRPAFAENVDVQTSNRCDHGCPMCYANCTKDGAFGKLSGWKFLETLHAGTEMAVNLNFPMAPDFIDFLRYVKSKGVYPNVTINQDHFMQHEDVIQKLYEEKLIYGLGVSLTNPTSEFISRIQKYPDAVIHVINGLYTKEQNEILKHNNLKLLILGFKDVGRGVGYHRDADSKIQKNQKWLYNYMTDILTSFEVVSFDNLGVEQLDIRRLLSEDQWREFYGGDDGEFTFFLNLVDGYFSKNSLSKVRYLIGDLSMDEMFDVIKKETIDL